MRNIILSTSLLILLSTSSAFAHAHVESSEPSAGQVLASPPDAVTITFNEKLRPNESSIDVYDAQKKQIEGMLISKKDNTDTLTESLPKLSPGIYTVKWKAVCLCTDHHATKGSFKFTVK